MQVGMSICLIFILSILYVPMNKPVVQAFAAASGSQTERTFLQNSPLASPLALVQPAGDQEAEPKLNDVAFDSEQSAAEFQQRLPIYSGSRANQTSLVLIGAVLVGLIIVGSLVITRRD